MLDLCDSCQLGEEGYCAELPCFGKISGCRNYSKDQAVIDQNQIVLYEPSQTKRADSPTLRDEAVVTERPEAETSPPTFPNANEAAQITDPILLKADKDIRTPLPPEAKEGVQIMNHLSSHPHEDRSINPPGPEAETLVATRVFNASEKTQTINATPPKANDAEAIEPGAAKAREDTPTSNTTREDFRISESTVAGGKQDAGADGAMKAVDAKSNHTIARGLKKEEDHTIDTITHEAKTVVRPNNSIFPEENLDDQMIDIEASDATEKAQAPNVVLNNAAGTNHTSVPRLNEDVQMEISRAVYPGGDYGGSVNSEDVLMGDDSSLSEAADSDFADLLLSPQPTSAAPANSTSSLKSQHRKRKKERVESFHGRKFRRGQPPPPTNRERLRRQVSKGVSFAHLFELENGLTEDDPPELDKSPKPSRRLKGHAHTSKPDSPAICMGQKGPNRALEQFVSDFQLELPSKVQSPQRSPIDSKPLTPSRFLDGMKMSRRPSPTIQETLLSSPKDSKPPKFSPTSLSIQRRHKKHTASASSVANSRFSSTDSTRGEETARPPDPFGCGCMPKALRMLEDLEMRNQRIEEYSGDSIGEVLAPCLLKCTEILDCRPCSQTSEYMMFLVIICQKTIKGFSRLATTCASSPVTPDGKETLPLTGVVLFQLPRLETVLTRLKIIATQRNWKTHLAMLDPLSQHFQDTRDRLRRINGLRIQSNDGKD